MDKLRRQAHRPSCDHSLYDLTLNLIRPAPIIIQYTLTSRCHYSALAYLAIFLSLARITTVPVEDSDSSIRSDGFRPGSMLLGARSPTATIVSGTRDDFQATWFV